MKRVSKKQKAINSEVNKVFDDFDKFDIFVKRHWKEMIYASVGIVVIVALIFFGYNKKEEKAIAAQNALANATTIPELEQAIASYGQYEAANFARIVLARLYINENEYDKALAALDAVVKNSTIKEQKENALLEQAYLIEKQDKIEEAITKFASIGNDKNLATIVRAEALYGAARLSYSEKNNEQATQYIQAIEVIYPSNDNASFNMWISLSRTLASIIDSQVK